MKAPFKRGTRLIYTCPTHGTKHRVKYVKWLGFERSSLIIVQDEAGTRLTVHVKDVCEVK